MSTLIKSIVFILFSVNLFAQQPIMTDDYIEVKFTKETTQQNLSDIKTALKERNIDIEYTETTFDKTGQLEGISFKVDCNDGYSGSASMSTKGIVGLLTDLDVGFYRDYRENSSSSFGSGTFKSKK